MKKKHFLPVVAIISFFACSSPENNKEEVSEVSNEWELQILDSIQVDYLADVRDGNFEDGIGVIKNISSNTLVKFDTTGKILIKKEYPKEGPGSLWKMESFIIHLGELYGLTSFDNIYRFDESLNHIETLEMPFMGEARGGAYNRRNIRFWNDKLLVWYPGRDGISPYLDHFYRDSPLLELYDLKTRTSKSVVKTPPTSKYNSDEIFTPTYLNFAIEHDSLYLTFSNEPILHIYSMGDSILWERSIDFSASDFKLMPGQKKQLSYAQMITMLEARINGIYSDSSHIIVNYLGGIDGDIFVNNKLMEKENFHLRPNFQKNYLKIYQYGHGWPNEIVIPSSVGIILNIESLAKPFYALRNDDYIGEEQDYLTFYKLQLVQK